MLPLERFFNDQMDTALRMLHADDAYWWGFAFGLLCCYRGGLVTITDWHESLIVPGNDALVAQGYREGVRVMTEAAGGRAPCRPDAFAKEATNPVTS